MEKKTEKLQILKLVSNSLPADHSLEFGEDIPETEYFELLRSRLQYLLDHDMAGLLQAFYRMDLNEEKVREILAVSRPGDLAAELSELVWERARQKLETRRKYNC